MINSCVCGRERRRHAGWKSQVGFPIASPLERARSHEKYALVWVILTVVIEVVLLFLVAKSFFSVPEYPEDGNDIGVLLSGIFH